MTYVTEQNLTDVAMKRWSDIPDPRLREVMQSLIKHLHGFVRDVELRPDEWFAAIDWLTRTGQMCSGNRQEFILTSDVLAVSMLMDAINNRRTQGATPSTVEGPFHVPDAPAMANGANMADGAPGTPCFVTGTVRGLSGEPVAGAVLDLWQTDGEGRYEAQREGGDGPWMRGLYRTQPDGSYAIRTVAPISYTIPMDGTVGELVKRTNISHMRPAHIHFAITTPGYHSLVTHLFQRGDKYIDNDVVYGVKEPLIVEFKKRPPGKAPTGEQINEPFYVVHYDFVLEPLAKAAAA
jgi:hydroxyquinol 1,2-dioxygenase